MRRLAAALFLVAVLAACGDGEEDGRTARQTDEAAPGHATLTFSGTVSGRFDDDVEVACYPPAEEGERFTVSIDSDLGTPAGQATFLSLDLATPEYDGPKTYDLAKAIDAEPALDPSDFLLVFRENPADPYTWGDGENAGTITVERNEVSGRFDLEGWTNGTDGKVDVKGTFRCGRRSQSSN